MGWRWSAATATWTRLSGSARANRAHVRRFILLGLYTGTRPGVLPKLLWHESATQAWVDLDAGVVYRRGKAERDHRNKRRPLVRVPDRLLAHLRRWRAADERLQVRLRAAQVESGKEPTAVVGSVLHHGAEPIAGRLRRAFASCVRDAGLPPEITPHWMRHTCATWLMEADVAVWDAAAYAGMSTATLEKVYGHHRPTHQDRARRALR
jgi:integrase